MGDEEQNNMKIKIIMKIKTKKIMISHMIF